MHGLPRRVFRASQYFYVLLIYLVDNNNIYTYLLNVFTFLGALTKSKVKVECNTYKLIFGSLSMRSSPEIKPLGTLILLVTFTSNKLPYKL